MGTRNEKKELAKILYLNGATQQEIAEKIGTHRTTIARWIKEEGWETIRAAKSITRPELVNKLLMQIARLLDEANANDDPAKTAGLADRLSKLAAIVDKLDRKANVVDAIEVFIAFGDWMRLRADADNEITTELIKSITKYQDAYINEQLTTGV